MNEAAVFPSYPIRSVASATHSSEFCRLSKMLSILCSGAGRERQDDACFSETLLYRAIKADCNICALQSNCCSNIPAGNEIHERAQEMAQVIAKSWERRTA